MDILYYSNYCKHSQKIVQALVKNNMQDKLSYICIDKRKKDTSDNQTYIYLENGNRVVMPPNLHSVPGLLMVSNNYQLIYGDDIMTNFHGDFKKNNTKTDIVKEPTGYSLLLQSSGGTHILSEKYTNYDMTPDELSTKSTSNTRQMYNYVSANDTAIFIETPPDNYTPDKLSENTTLDDLQQKRIDDLGLNKENPQLTGKI